MKTLNFCFVFRIRGPGLVVLHYPLHTYHSPITLSGVDHCSLVGGFNPQLPLSRLQVPLKGVNTANVKPHELLQRPRTGLGYTTMSHRNSP
jgi:hypothetical protein